MVEKNMAIEIKIRKAKKEDLKKLMQLDKEASEEIRWWSRINPATFLRRIKKNLVYIAEYNKDIIGFQVGNIKESGLMLEDLYVKKNFRKRGVAKKLIRRFISNQRLKFNTIFLHCPKRLRGFYEKLGFKQTAIIMVKNKMLIMEMLNCILNN